MVKSFLPIISMNQTSLSVRRSKDDSIVIPRSLWDANNECDSQERIGMGGVGSSVEPRICPDSAVAVTSLPGAVGQQPRGDALMRALFLRLQSSVSWSTHRLQAG